MKHKFVSLDGQTRFVELCRGDIRIIRRPEVTMGLSTGLRLAKAEKLPFHAFEVLPEMVYVPIATQATDAWHVIMGSMDGDRPCGWSAYERLLLYDKDPEKLPLAPLDIWAIRSIVRRGGGIPPKLDPASKVKRVILTRGRFTDNRRGQYSHHVVLHENVDGKLETQPFRWNYSVVLHEREGWEVGVLCARRNSLLRSVEE